MNLVGKTIVSVLPLTRAMADQTFGPGTWRRYQQGVVLVLDDGTQLIPSQDPEGNGAGCLFARHKGEYYILQPAGGR